MKKKYIVLLGVMAVLSGALYEPVVERYEVYQIYSEELSKNIQKVNFKSISNIVSEGACELGAWKTLEASQGFKVKFPIQGNLVDRVQEVGAENTGIHLFYDDKSGFRFFIVGILKKGQLLNLLARIRPSFRKKSIVEEKGKDTYIEKVVTSRYEEFSFADYLFRFDKIIYNLILVKQKEPYILDDSTSNLKKFKSNSDRDFYILELKPNNQINRYQVFYNKDIYEGGTFQVSGVSKRQLLCSLNSFEII